MTSPHMPATSRSGRLDRLTATTLDVLVIGGGIVGAGIARDAAMRGLRVALVDQHDVAFGTSSRSSRLLHGGLRYLAQGRLGLVREASVEKRVLHDIAPHLAQPLPFVFPTYRGTPWPLWQLSVGVKIYDLLCGGRNFGASRSMSVADVSAHLPDLQPAKLTGAVRYYDALTNDARLVLDTLRSAAQYGALVCNYTRFEEAGCTGKNWECLLCDVVGDRPLQITARSVVNASGPWADRPAQSRVRLRLTKGVHLVVDHARLPVPDAVVMSQEDRILFIIPWGERVILGTTDTDFDGTPESVQTNQDDVAYILDVANHTFPSVELTEDDVLSTWSGLRPLIASSSGGPSDISRAHQIRMPEPGWLDVAGGKLTTYRLIAQQAVDRLVSHLGCGAGRCTTASQPLLASEPSETGQGQGISGIVPPPVGRAAVEHFCRDEWVWHLDDVMRRRTSWHYYLPNAADTAEQVAQWMAEFCGWSEERRQAELLRYREMPS